MRYACLRHLHEDDWWAALDFPTPWPCDVCAEDNKARGLPPPHGRPGNGPQNADLWRAYDREHPFIGPRQRHGKEYDWIREQRAAESAKERR